MKEDGSLQWDRIAKAYQEMYGLGTDDVHYGPRCPKESKLKLLGNVRGKKL